MSAPAPARPEANEYASYYEKYVSLVPEADVVKTLERQGAETLALLRGLDEGRGGGGGPPPPARSPPARRGAGRGAGPPSTCSGTSRPRRGGAAAPPAATK